LDTPSVVAQCTATNAAGIADWQSYMFADNFHPTPKGHQLLSDIVVSRLRAVGWK
jgi:outer membrane lipase/esterase